MSNNKPSHNYEFFSHTSCEFFPCHPIQNPENFNCLFCYCPLYLMGETCGGNFTYTPGGVKDCSACLLPHRRENYSYIVGKLMEGGEKP
ncbi:metal-binding protein [Pseudoflavonifractor sp. An44]|uniref:cysteine-rich small domain-containing protein n=1 Tax=Pseudoflavonifractor sp. An44 TaxID=1965635 RepID=UPI000B37E0A0|nr:cysteine-rich small domain-containing protein [Pseudoflavonifractor sp. An44]OUN97009.1 metal-binding protein [Pseudoflavonifractor sp. An44]